MGIMKLAGEYDREIKLFVDGMRYKLHANRHKGKWENLSSKDAFKHLEAEVKELKDAIEVEDEDRNLMNVLQEAVDVANMAMILFNIELSSANKTLDLDEKLRWLDQHGVGEMALSKSIISIFNP